MTINEILNHLASDNSRIFKENVLTQHKDNQVLKKVIFAALDPFTQYYIRKIPKYQITDQETENLDWALSQIKVLSSREKTGNAAIDHLAMILTNIKAGDAKVIERIIEKDLKCGVSVATVNKIWPKMIHEFPVMLSSAFDQKILDKFNFPAVAQEKLDGMRCNIIVDEGKVSVRSRNGKFLETHGCFDQAFIEMSEDTDIVFDGELMVIFPENDGIEELSKSSRFKPIFHDRKTGNGICNKAVKGTISEKEANTLHIVLYDVIDNLEDWQKGIHKVPYRERVTKLSNILSKHKEWIHKASLVDGKLVSNAGETIEYFNELYSSGKEGIILKDLTHQWEDKRSKGLLKFKGEEVCELRIVGVQEGTGKYAGCMGAILCESEDGIIKVSVGSGFNDEQRKLTDWIGKIVSVKYNARIKDKAGTESLFLPIFQEIREDKDTADNSKSIK